MKRPYRISAAFAYHERINYIMKFTVALLLIISIFQFPVFSAEEIGKISITLNKTAVNVGEYFEATIKVENITAEFIIVPIHFNENAVKVADMNGELVLSGIKTANEAYDGRIGITPLQSLSGDPLYWNGTVFDNLLYPEINNEKGFYRLMFSNTRSREIVSETLISIKFLAIGVGDSDIRFADKNDELFDPIAGNGALFVYADQNGNPLDDLSVSKCFSNVSTTELKVRLQNMIRRTIKNSSGRKIDCVSIIAAYDGIRMVDMSIKSVSLPANESVLHECDIGTIDNSIKHFVLNDFTNITPSPGIVSIK